MTESEREHCEDALHAATKGNPKWWGSMPGIWRDQFEDGWRKAWAAATAPRPAPEGTVRVRVPVVTRSDGEWVAVRHSTMPEDHVEDYATNCIGHPDHRMRVSYLVGDVPLPSPPVEVKGEVEA